MSTAEAAPTADAPTYAERLTVGWWFWLGLVVIVVVGVFEVAGGFNHVIIIPVTVFLVGFFIVPFLITGLTPVRIKDGTLRAGKHEIPVMSIAGISTLDREQTRLRLGPQADPAAVLVHRGWIQTSVMLRLSNPNPTPYWVVSTRRPEELAAAIKAARNHVRATR